MTNQAAATATSSTSTSSAGTSTAAGAARVTAAADRHSGGCRGGRHEHCSPSGPSEHVPPFSHGHTRGRGRLGSTAEGRAPGYGIVIGCIRYIHFVSVVIRMIKNEKLQHAH